MERILGYVKSRHASCQYGFIHEYMSNDNFSVEGEHDRRTLFQGLIPEQCANSCSLEFCLPNCTQRSAPGSHLILNSLAMKGVLGLASAMANTTSQA